MKPITLLITATNTIVLPHILVPEQTNGSIKLEDGRCLFLPKGLNPSEIAEQTYLGEWAITCGVRVQAASDKTGKLAFEYIEIKPDETSGFLVYINAVLPVHATLRLLLSNGIETTPVCWILPRRNASAGSIQNITGMFEVPDGVALQYTVIQPGNNQFYSTINLNL